MMLANQSMSDFYEAVCAKHDINTNVDILQALEKLSVTKNFLLKIPGNGLQLDQKLNDNDVLALSKCLQKNKCVTGLDLSYNNISDIGAIHLAELLEEKDSSLRLLDLVFNNIMADGAEVLVSSLQSNGSLLSLRLSGNNIGDRGGTELAIMLQENNTLQELDLANCNLSTKSVMALTIMLKTNKALRSVDISRPLLFSHREDWSVHCSEMLAANSMLVELHLGKMGMTDSAVEQFSKGLKQNRSLRYLDLSCNRMTRNGAYHLAMMLKQNTTLEILDLSSNVIEDEGAIYLSYAIAWPGCILKELSVCSNNIGTEGLLSLAEAMKAETTLSHIYIWGNRLEESVCKAFQELMSSGRLPPEQTDVIAFKVDGHVRLADVFRSLRKRVYSIDLNSTDTVGSPETTFPPHTKEKPKRQTTAKEKCFKDEGTGKKS